MRIDFARLNHVLIPKTKDDRDRFRRGRLGQAVLPLLAVWESLTEDGRTLAIVAPLAGAVAVDVQRTSAYVIFPILVGVVVGSLVAARALRLDGTAVHVSAPRRVTVGDEVTFTVACHRDARESPPVALRVRGPFLPWDGR